MMALRRELFIRVLECPCAALLRAACSAPAAVTHVLRWVASNSPAAGGLGAQTTDESGLPVAISAIELERLEIRLQVFAILNVCMQVAEGSLDGTDVNNGDATTRETAEAIATAMIPPASPFASTEGAVLRAIRAAWMDPGHYYRHAWQMKTVHRVPKRCVSEHALLLECFLFFCRRAVAMGATTPEQVTCVESPDVLTTVITLHFVRILLTI